MDETRFAILRQAVTDGEPAAAASAAREALAAGFPPLRLIDEAAMPALREVGEGFSNGDLFLPDLMLAARAMQAAMRAARRRHRVPAASGAHRRAVSCSARWPATSTRFLPIS